MLRRHTVLVCQYERKKNVSGGTSDSVRGKKRKQENDENIVFSLFFSTI